MGIFELLKNYADHMRPTAHDPADAARLGEAARLVKAYLHEVNARGHWWDIKPQDVPTGRAILEADPALQIAVLYSLFTNGQVGQPISGWLLRPLVSQLSRRRLPYTEADILRLTGVASSRSELTIKQAAARTLEWYVAKNGLSGPLREAVGKLRASVHPKNPDYHKLVVRIDALLGGEAVTVVKPGEPWGDTVLVNLAALPAEQRAAWNGLLAHALSSESTRPSKKWLTGMMPLLETVGKERFQEQVLIWFDLFKECAPTLTGQAQTYEQYEAGRKIAGVADHNHAVLKGLIWCCQCLEAEAIPPALGDLAQAALRKIPGIGPKSAKVGNACVVTLGAMSGLAPVAQLSRLKMRVKYQASLGLVETALAAAAARADLPPEDLEELAVPSFGLDRDGRLREEFGGIVAELTVTGMGREDLIWTDGNGRLVKSVPAEVRRDHAEALKALKRSVEEINKSLPAQRERVERLMLSGRNWGLADWRERYLDHPLLGRLSRRLIWHFEREGRTGLGIWRDGRLVDEAGVELDWVDLGTRVPAWECYTERVKCMRRGACSQWHDMNRLGRVLDAHLHRALWGGIDGDNIYIQSLEDEQEARNTSVDKIKEEIVDLERGRDKALRVAETMQNALAGLDEEDIKAQVAQYMSTRVQPILLSLSEKRRDLRAMEAQGAQSSSTNSLRQHVLEHLRIVLGGWDRLPVQDRAEAVQTFVQKVGVYVGDGRDGCEGFIRFDWKHGVTDYLVSWRTTWQDRRDWTAEEDEALRELWPSSVTWEGIQERLLPGRKFISVWNRSYTLGLKGSGRSMTWYHECKAKDKSWGDLNPSVLYLQLGTAGPEHCLAVGSDKAAVKIETPEAVRRYILTVEERGLISCNSSTFWNPPACWR